MNTEPKPASGELPDINEIVMDLRQATGSPENLHRAFFNILQPIYDKHNAALTAEKEKHRPSEIAGIKTRWPEVEEIQKLRTQLAAERSNAEKAAVRAELAQIDLGLLQDDYRAIADSNRQLREQLAAERDRMDALLDRQDKGHAEYAAKMTKELQAQIADRKQLRAQLAAAQAEEKAAQAAYGMVCEQQEQAIAEATKPLVEKITELEGRLSKYEQS